MGLEIPKLTKPATREVHIADSPNLLNHSMDYLQSESYMESMDKEHMSLTLLSQFHAD